MGKGDKKTKRGKIVIGSSGVRRARKKKGRKPVILHKAEPKPKDNLEQNPVVPVPEITSIVEQVEVKVPRKTAAKKATPKKPVEKVDEGETKSKPKPKPKPKPAKSKKPAAKPGADLFTEKKEGTE
jgi:ribosomal small subunit protein bTHX